MPRKFSDWRSIRNNYYKATRIDFPYPNEQSVVYDWSSSNFFWEDRRKTALDYLSSSKFIFDANYTELTALGGRVKTQGEAERKKERDFLKNALPDLDFDSISDTDLIQKLNEIMHGKKQYENALTRIHAAIRDSNDTGRKNLAPSVSSLFTSYLGTELSNVFKEFVAQAKPSDPYIAWTSFLENHLNEAIDKAFRAMTEEIGTKDREVNPIYGDVDQWREIGEAYRTIEGFAQEFQQMIRSKINFDAALNMFKDEKNRKIYDSARRKSKKPGFRTYIDNALHLKSQAGQRGGSVNEYIQDIIKKIVPKLVTVTDSGSKVIGSEITLPDSVAVYNFNSNIDISAQQIADSISDSLNGTTSLKESARRLDEFYEKNLKKLNNSFIVYESDKMYKLDRDFSGFHGGGKHPLTQLSDYIEEAGISAAVGLDFIYTAYNTLPSAVYAGERQEIQEQITNILTAAAAKLLFNDWSTVGTANTGARVLHVLNLDGVLIPSSYILINLGQAMINAASDMRRWFAVSVKLPETTVYHEGDWKGWGKDKDIKDKIYTKWREQFETAERESSFSVKFLSNFKSIIGSLG